MESPIEKLFSQQDDPKWAAYPISPLEAIKLTHKKPQFILAADASYFANNDNFRTGITLYPMARFLVEVQDSLCIREREWLETNPKFRQLIPYTVITTELHGNKLFWPYQRMQTVGEQRLAGKVSVGFGGHIDLASVVYDKDSVLDLQQTLRHSCDREIEEEVRAIGEYDPSTLASKHPSLVTWAQPEFENLFILHHEDVHAVHAGIVMSLAVPSQMRLECAEAELQMLMPMTAKELLGGDYELELWTRSYLEHCVSPAPF